MIIKTSSKFAYLRATWVSVQKIARKRAEKCQFIQQRKVKAECCKEIIPKPLA